MEKNLTVIENNCGKAPEGISYIDPGNDPNFVFANDPAFETITLYDVEGNIANMNSWIECAHYVNGGWRNSQLINFQGDKILFFLVFSAAVIVSLFYFSNFRKKYASK